MLCGDEHLAEDLAQAALERAFPKWRRIVRGGNDPYPYVRRILVNLNISRLRRRFRENPTADIAEDTSTSSPPPDADRVALTRALAILTERERKVVALRYLEDVSEAQTAAELGLPQGTVKSCASRALAKLRASQQLAIGPVR
jgi:RNA polymerase sigma-70 factor (sigma-E family)